MNTWDFFLNKFGRKNTSVDILPDSNTLDNNTELGGQNADTLSAQSAFSVGNGNNIAIITGKDPLYRLWIGNQKPDLAPFSVDKDGNTVMNKGKFSGNITVGGAANVSGVITTLGPTGNKRIVQDNSGIVIIGANGGAYYFKDTEAGGVVGTYTYNSTYGVTLETTSGQHISMKSAATIGMYPETSFIVMATTLDVDMLGYRNAYLNAGTGNLTLTAIAGPALMEGYTTATVTADTGAALVKSTTGNAKLWGANTATVLATDGILTIRADGDFIHLYTGAQDGNKILLQSGGNIDLIVKEGYYLTTDREEMYFRNNKILTVLGSMTIPASGTTLTINGSSKTAIVPTKKGYKALYTNESPNVWFNDFAKIIYPPWYKFWNKPTVVVDETFIEVTSAPYHIIPTMNKNIVQIWGIRKGFEKIRFEDKTKEQFEENNNFWDTPNK